MYFPFSDQLLQLAKLLRVSGDNELQRKGSVLVLIAQSAIQAKDYHTAYQMCSDIIKVNYGDGWEVCYNLADEGAFNDLQARRQLIAFAAGYCHTDSIEDIMRIRNNLETQVSGLFNLISMIGRGKIRTNHVVNSRSQVQIQVQGNYIFRR